MLNVIPLKLLYILGVRNLFIYLRYFYFNYIKRRILSFKYTKKKGWEYFRVLGHDVIKPKTRKKSFDEFIASL